jgi:hypothetical protein
MAGILEFPLTRDQRGAKERLVKAMREFNAAVKFAAKTGLKLRFHRFVATPPTASSPLRSSASPLTFRASCRSSTA